ncbi:Cytochrome c domain-containing protein [Lachancea thermotolerans]
MYRKLMKLRRSASIISHEHTTELPGVMAIPNLRSRGQPRSSSVDMRSTEQDVEEEPADAPQVLFMDNQDVGNRTGHPPPSYYQVATPKSPHELSLADESEERPETIVGSVHHESEESERLKYETAKREILDLLNLHIMLSNNEHNEIDTELGRVEAQMKVLEHMHKDKDLLEKVNQHQEELYQRSRDNFLNKKEAEASQSPTSISFGSLFGEAPSSNASQGNYFYHTRSKSSHNITNAYQSRLRPANNGTMDMRLTGGKQPNKGDQPPAAGSSGNEFDLARPPLLNQHHRRNYSSTCLTSNSGVVGSNEKNEPIFKRPDGILVIIACSFCERSGFTSAQGIVNHVRLKHAKTYSSQPLAVLNNQHVLPKTLQPPEVMQQFKELHLDPSNDYLPNILNPQAGASANTNSDRKNSTRELSPKSKYLATHSPSKAAKKSTKHLKKLYNRDDFKDIVDYVSEAQRDLDAILKQPSESEANFESDDPDAKDLQGPRSSSRSSTKSSFAARSSPENTNERKRSSSPEMDAKKRHKPAEKKVRPDAIALMNIPERDKRSSHYNLRAKSKLRGHSRYE